MNISGINTVEGEAMKSIRFSIPGQPMGKQRPRVVHNGSFSQAFTPKETVSYSPIYIWMRWISSAKGFCGFIFISVTWMM